MNLSKEPKVIMNNFSSRVLGLFSKVLSNKVKLEDSILTEPGESPNTFNGEQLSNIKSPNGGKALYKFYTKSGSEYLFTSDNMSRRIKNTDKYDAGLQPWMKCIFIPKSIFDDWENNEDSQVRILTDSILGNADYNIWPEVSGKYFKWFIQMYKQTKITQLVSIEQIWDIKDNEVPNPHKYKDTLTFKNILLEPKKGYCVFEYKVDEYKVDNNWKDKNIVNYHFGHEITYIEK